MTAPTPGTYLLRSGGRLTVFEPISATNPPAGSENWPLTNLTVFAPIPGATERRSEIETLSRQLADRLAAVPVDQRAELVAAVNAELARALAPPADDAPPAEGFVS